MGYQFTADFKKNSDEFQSLKRKVLGGDDAIFETNTTEGFKTIFSKDIQVISGTSNYYAFVMDRENLFSKEVHNLSLVLNKEKSNSDEVKRQWKWYRYCCRALELCYDKKHYDNYLKRLKIEQCWAIAPDEITANTTKEQAQRAIFVAILEDFFSWFKRFLHISIICGDVGFINLCRIYWIFLRLSLVTSLTYMMLAPRMNAFYGHFAKSIKVFQGPNNFFYFLSVAIFAFRICLYFLTLIKHGYFPNEGEEGYSFRQRISYELWEDLFVFINDFMWIIVNLVTNYPSIFHIHNTGFIIGFTIACLIIDATVVGVAKHFASQEFYAKDTDYALEINKWNKELAEITINADNNQLVNKLSEMIRFSCAQREENKLCWDGKNAGYNWKMTAAVLAFIGFAGFAVCPLTIMVGLLGIGMFFSAEAYENYRLAGLRHENALAKGNDVSNTSLVLADMRKEFLYTFIKNIFIPAATFLMFSFCWPMGIAWTAFLITVEVGKTVYDGYLKEEPNANPVLSLDSPPPSGEDTSIISLG